MNLDPFTNLRVLNISSMEIDDLNSIMFDYNGHLERIIASHNRLTILDADEFCHNCDKLVELDFSYNQISKLHIPLFAKTEKLKSINLSHNVIENLDSLRFTNLQDLKLLDLSNNKINVIEPMTYIRKLKILNLNNNQLKRLECEFLSRFTEWNGSLEILINTLEEVETTCNNNDNHIDFDIVISPEESTTRLRVLDGKFQWIFSEVDFINIHRLSFSNDRTMNMLDSTEESNTPQETLYVSDYYFIDQLYGAQFLLVALVAIILIVILVNLIVGKCKCSKKNYKKNLSIYAIESSLLHDNNQYQKISSEQHC